MVERASTVKNPIREFKWNPSQAIGMRFVPDITIEIKPNNSERGRGTRIFTRDFIVLDTPGIPGISSKR